MSHLHGIDGRVPIAELGGYANLGSFLGWGVSPDADGLVEVQTPFVGLCFSSTPEADLDGVMTRVAWNVLQKSDYDMDNYEGERLRSALARRAGAALWLSRRDERMFPSHQFGGWTFRPMSSPSGMDLQVGENITLRAHVLLNGVFQTAAWLRIESNGAMSSSFSKKDDQLHKELVAFACRLAELAGEAAVTRAQDQLDLLRSRLTSIRPA